MFRKFMGDRRVRYVALGFAAVAVALCSLPDRHSPHATIGLVKAASAAEPVKASTPSIDLDKVKPNEAGVVPILMYHNIIGDKIYQMKYPVALFKSDLEWLYKHNYRPVNLGDFVKGRVDVPAGMSPVILTFDDSLKSQFNYLPNGKINPNCVVAIMDKFHADHPDWLQRATFFVIAGSPTLPAPFYQRKSAKEKLEYMVKQGYEIGNHTVHHPQMNRLSDVEATEEIAGCVKAIHKYLPDYDVDTLALPYGLFPKNSAVLKSGDIGGQSYRNCCAMAAGWSPADSPIDKRFHPYELERIQAGDERYQSHWWLNWLEKHPSKKYISDGDSNTFTVPTAKMAMVDKNRVASLGVEIRTYGESHLAKKPAKASTHLAKKPAKASTHLAKSKPAKASLVSAKLKPSPSAPNNGGSGSSPAKDLTLIKTGGYTPRHN